jgi:DNA-binding phage protein
MTDRHMGYVVVLDHDIRSDDAEYILNALRMVKGVQQVTPIVNEVGVSSLVEMRLRTDLKQKVVKSVIEQFETGV